MQQHPPYTWQTARQQQKYTSTSHYSNLFILMWSGETAAAVLHIQGGDNITANVTCQTASSFTVPSSPLQYEVLIILLSDP